MDPEGRPVLVMVTGGGDEQAHPVVLLSPDAGLGGDRDLFLAPEDTGLPYEVVAQADVFGYVWAVQLDPPLGTTPPPLLAAVEGLQRAEPDRPAPDSRAGPPIATRADPRWRHKEQELMRLQAVAGDCARQLVDGPPHLLIDPMALRPPADGEDPFEVLAFISGLADRVRTGTVDTPAWLLDQVLAGGALAEAYRRAGLFDGYQVLVRLAEYVLHSLAGETVPGPAERGLAVADVLERARGDVLSQELGHGHSSVWLLSREADVGPAPRPERRYAEGRMIQCVRTPCRA